MSASPIIREVTIGDYRFKTGHTPWNKGLKGIHLSPGSQWKKGCESNRKLPVGSLTIRHRKREKHPRAWVKVAEPNIWRERAKVVWEKAHGPIPRGMVIHHKDRNPLNDDLANLQAMTRREHAVEHEHELREARNAS
jgi:hypothetical protein